MMNTKNENLDQQRGKIFNIQDFAVQDGPGIRTVLFLKGCPMRCQWCANPEGQEYHAELMHSKNICLQCKTCATACPYDAITYGVDGYPVFQRELCRECTTYACEQNCIPRAVKRMGIDWTPDDIFKKVRNNSLFYRNSEGGVTLSGGEALTQPDFVREFITRCETTGLSVGVETCGYFNWSQVADFIAKLDFYYFDLKSLDAERHREVTGRELEPILENLRCLAAIDPRKIVVTIAVIPGVNDTEEMMQSAVQLCHELGITKLRLLAYHAMGKEKYRELDRPYLMDDCLKMESQRMRQFQQMLLEEGLDCWIE